MMKIQDLLKQAKPCWKYAAMDADYMWYFYTMKPFIEGNVWMFARGKCKVGEIEDFFDIELFDGDWKDSLICREECGL